MTYKEFLKSLNEETDDRTDDEIGLILYCRDSILSVKDSENWTIPKDRLKILETKDQGVVRLFKQVFDLDVDGNRFDLISTKFNSNRGKLYLYTYQCRSNYRTNGYIDEAYSDSNWYSVDDLPKPFCRETIDYIKQL